MLRGFPSCLVASRKEVIVPMTSRKHPSVAGTHSGGQQDSSMPVLSEDVVYKRYLTLYNQRVRFPTGVEHDFDVVGHPQSLFKFAVTFPFHPATEHSPAQVTLLREYCQGPNEMMYVLPTGGYDARKHSTLQACAAAELSEEASLSGGSWVPLLEEGHPGIAEVKWCRNRFQPFLCIDPQADATPGARDAEELIEVQRYALAELQALMVSGHMLLPSVATCFMALEKLKNLGHLP